MSAYMRQFTRSARLFYRTSRHSTAFTTIAKTTGCRPQSPHLAAAPCACLVNSSTLSARIPSLTGLPHQQYYRPINARYSSNESGNGELSDLEFERVVEESLDHLAEFFEILGDSDASPADFDVTFSSGVLTVCFGEEHGTYVINKQSPNKQIWLSSPTSGPKRYDYVNKRWVYSHDGKALHDLLTEEISQIMDTRIDVTEAEQWNT